MDLLGGGESEFRVNKGSRFDTLWNLLNNFRNEKCEKSGDILLIDIDIMEMQKGVKERKQNRRKLTHKI